MERDFRPTEWYREAENLYGKFRQPGTGLVIDASEISSNDARIVFAGTVAETLDTVRTQICSIDLQSGELQILTSGLHSHHLPRLSPDGQVIAFLSDQHGEGNDQLYLLDLEGCVTPAPHVEGWVEDFRWSPDGRRILLRVAGHGADTACVHGAVPTHNGYRDQEGWMPLVADDSCPFRWRRLWIYELTGRRVSRVSPENQNVWEAAWCGNAEVVGVMSTGAAEGRWYGARICLLDIAHGHVRVLYEPRYQLGGPCGSPSGQHVAFIEALCSDRWLVAGDLLVVELKSQRIQRCNTRGVDVTYLEWRSDQQLLVAGQRGPESVVGVFNRETAEFTEAWASADITSTGLCFNVSGFGEPGDCALVAEGFNRSPEIGVIRRGCYRGLKSLTAPTTQESPLRSADRVSWEAPDGLEVQGWLLRPLGDAPHPVLMNIHGGPVWHWRPFWLGRRSAHLLMLLRRGYAIFLPNPRGSSGRGQEFARRVLGEPGGGDAQDCLSGIDHLVTCGIADPKRLGVTGLSYGGFMTAWLVTQDDRFAAAVAVSPHTNFVTYHLLSNIPEFVTLFLLDTYRNPGGNYYRWSPIIHARRANTPTLNICGAIDRCTPPEEAAQFHNALQENGVESVLVTYPHEGHGIRNFPAAIDYAARVVAWFDQHIPGVT